MENRFGFVHFVISFLLIVLIGVIWLGMLEMDRMWGVLAQLQDASTNQTRQLNQIRQAIDNGVSPAPATATGPTGANNNPTTASSWSNSFGDPFAALKAAERRPDFARGDWLVQNLGEHLPRITPMISSDLAAVYIQSRVIESLVYRDPDTFKYQPLLAKSWQISPDGLTITLQLRKGITFSDGEPMTADDVLYSFNMIMDPKIDDPRDRSVLDKVQSLTKTNDYEVVFKLKEPYFLPLDLCGINVLPKHFYSQFSDEEINTNPGLLMGTGPYKMADPKSWRPGGDKVELIRNESYWGEPPTFDRLIYRQVEDEAAEEAMFQNGELDIFGPEPEQFVKLLKDSKLMARSVANVHSSLMNGYNYIAWNEKQAGKPTPFADVRVRTAMTLLTDRARILQDVYLGYGSVASGPFDPSSPQADPTVKPLPYDPVQAKKLLADAGYFDRDGSGNITGPDGQPFHVRLTYPSGSATYERVVLQIKDSFAKGGVVLEPDPEDWPIVVEHINHRDFQAITLGWSGSIEDDLYSIFDSSQQADDGDNCMSYSNPELDKVMEEARRTVDDAKRMDLWHQAHRILAHDQPYTFMLCRQSIRLSDKRIQNIGSSKLGSNFIEDFPMPCPWYVPKALQKYAQ